MNITTLLNKVYFTPRLKKIDLYANRAEELQHQVLNRLVRMAENTEWVEDAGVISVCYCLQYPELPLKGNYDDSKFKIYYPDTGLLIEIGRASCRERV